MNIFEFDDYRIFTQNWIKKQPKAGHGENQRMAQYIDIPASVLSQTLSGKRNLNVERAFLLCEYLQLKFVERDYFIYLVKYAEASNYKYKKYLKEKIEKLKADSKNIGRRIPETKTLDVLDQVEFYSSWLYSAIRLHCSIGRGATFKEIMIAFQISEVELSKIIDFLIRTLLLTVENGRYLMGQQKLTYVGKDSPLLSKHHANWRIKSLEKTMRLTDSDYFMTVPMTCSKVDAEKIKLKVSQMMYEVTEIIKQSEAEEQIYLGIDFFKINKNEV